MFIEVIASLLVVVVALAIRSSIVIVSYTTVGIVEFLGNYRRTLQPGLNFVIPFLEKIVNYQSVRETVIYIDHQSVITADNASLEVDAIAFYKIKDPVKATYAISDFSNALNQLVQTNLRTVTGSLVLDDVLSKRDIINTRLLNILHDATVEWGLEVLRVEVKRILPAEVLQLSLNKQLAAERNRRATVLEAQAKSQSVVLQAEAERAKQFQLAEGRERTAIAEAKAISVINDSLQRNSSAGQFIIAQSYVNALKDLSGSQNSKTIFLPADAASFFRTISALKEVLSTLPDSQPEEKPKPSDPTKVLPSEVKSNPDV